MIFRHSLFLFPALLAGYVREVLFIWINAASEHAEKNMNNTPPPSFIAEMSTGYLQVLKWGLTLFFIFVQASILLLALKVLTNNRVFIRWILRSYILCMAILCLVGGIAYISGVFNTCYPFIRYVAGILQGPIPYMLAMAFYLSITQKDTDAYTR